MTDSARTRSFSYLTLHVLALVILSGPVCLALAAIYCGMTRRTLRRYADRKQAVVMRLLL